MTVDFYTIMELFSILKYPFLVFLGLLIGYYVMKLVKQIKEDSPQNSKFCEEKK